MSTLIDTLMERWKASTPEFFKWVMGIGTSIAGTALAIQMGLETSHAQIPDWWTSVYPYLIGIGAGMSATAKFTQKQ